jgi:hypothetical protein
MLRFTCFVCAAALAFAACRKEPGVMHPKEGELPPLPPASGTAIGYLVDNATQLKLRDDQLKQLKEIDTSLAARNDSIDTQLRSIEKPNEEEAPKGAPPPRHNHAPGAQIKTTGDAAKLHEAKSANDKEALTRAFALLDADQQAMARRLLDERGISAPGSQKKEPTRDANDGTPLPGEP